MAAAEPALLMPRRLQLVASSALVTHWWNGLEASLALLPRAVPPSPLRLLHMAA